MSTTGDERRRVVTIGHAWATVAVLVPVIGVLLARLGTVDLTYHLRAGNIMLDTHRLLDTDTFTFSSYGAHWLNQQWAAQVLFAMIQRAGGFGALALLRGVLTLLTFGFILLACRETGASLRRAALLTTVSFVLALSQFSMRPQMFGIALFGASLWLVEARRRRPGSLWAMPLLMVAWVNMHGSFVLAPVLLGLAFIQDLRDHDPGARRTLLVTGATVLATLATPFGVHVWVYAVTIGTNSTIRNLIVEWKPTTVKSADGVLFFLSVAALIAYLARRKEPVDWVTLLRFGVFFALALPAIRGSLWWGLAGPVIVAGMLPKETEPERPGLPMMNVAVVAALCLLTLVAIPRNGKTALGDPLLQDAPAGIVGAARQDLPSGSRVFVSQIWGSWFEYAVPDMPVFVDSRIEIYPQAVWNDYFYISRAGDGWEQAVDRWQVDAMLLDTQQAAPLVDRMLQSPQWRLVYHREDGYLFVRSTS